MARYAQCRAKTKVPGPEVVETLLTIASRMEASRALKRGKNAYRVARTHRAVPGTVNHPKQLVTNRGNSLKRKATRRLTQKQKFDELAYGNGACPIDTLHVKRTPVRCRRPAPEHVVRITINPPGHLVTNQGDHPCENPKEVPKTRRGGIRRASQ